MEIKDQSKDAKGFLKIEQEIETEKTVTTEKPKSRWCNSTQIVKVTKTVTALMYQHLVDIPIELVLPTAGK